MNAYGHVKKNFNQTSWSNLLMVRAKEIKKLIGADMTETQLLEPQIYFWHENTNFSQIIQSLFYQIQVFLTRHIFGFLE